MAGSLKDALEKSGLAPGAGKDKPKPQTAAEKRKWREPLPDDETLPPLFEAPALTKPTEPPPRPPKTTKR